MADIGSVEAKLGLNVEGLMAAAKAVAQAGKQMESALGGAYDSTAKLEKGQKAMAEAADKTLKKIATAVQAGANAYKEAVASQEMLQRVAGKTGTAVESLTEASRRLAADGLLSPQQANTAIANMVQYGLTVTQAEAAVERLKDASTTLRQDQYGLGEAVVIATSGVRQELSTLTQAAGVTETVGQMMETYAQSIGKTAETLTQAERAQATYEGIMRSTAGMAGDAAKAADSFAAAEARHALATKETAAAYGEAMAPALKMAEDFGAQWQGFLGGLIKAFPEATARLSAFTGTATSLIGMAGTLKKMKDTLGSISGGGGLMAVLGGPVGWIGIAVSALAALTAGIAAHNAQQEEAKRQLAENVKTRADELTQLKALRAEYAALESKGSQSTDADKARLLEIQRDLVSKYGMMASGIDAEGRAYATSLKELEKYIAIKERELEITQELHTMSLIQSYDEDKKKADAARENLENRIKEERAARAAAEALNIMSKALDDVQAKYGKERTHKGDAIFGTLKDEYKEMLQAIIDIDGGKELLARKFHIAADEIEGQLDDLAGKLADGNDFGLGESTRSVRNQLYQESNAEGAHKTMLEAERASLAAGAKLTADLAGMVNNVVTTLRKGGQEVSESMVDFGMGLAEALSSLPDQLNGNQLASTLETLMTTAFSGAGTMYAPFLATAKQQATEAGVKAAEEIAAGAVSPETQQALDDANAQYENVFNAYVTTLKGTIENALAGMGIDASAVQWDNFLPKFEDYKVEPATLEPASPASLQSIQDQTAALERKRQAQQNLMLGQAEYIAGLKRLAADETLTAEQALFVNDELVRAKLAGQQMLAAGQAQDYDQQVRYLQGLLANETMYFQTRQDLERQLAEAQAAAQADVLADLAEYTAQNDASMAQQLAWLEAVIAKRQEDGEAVDDLQEKVAELNEQQQDEGFTAQLDALSEAFENGDLLLDEYIEGLEELQAQEGVTGKQAKLVQAEIDKQTKAFNENARKADIAAKANKRYADAEKDLGNQKKLEKHLKDVGQELADIGKEKAALKNLGDMKKRLDETGLGADAYRQELASVAQEMGLSPEALEGSLDELTASLSDSEIEARLLLAQLLGLDGSDLSMANAVAQLVQIGMEADVAKKLVQQLQKTMTSYGGKGGGKSSKGGGGGGKQEEAYSNDALKNALDELQHNVTMELLDPAQELAALEQIKAAYAQTTEEIWDMDERIWAAKKALYAEEIAKIQARRAMNQITAQEEDRLLAEAAQRYAVSAEQRQEAEQAAYERKMQLLADAYAEEKKLLDRQLDTGLHLDAYIARLEKLRRKYKEHAELLAEIDDELYDLRQQQRERDLERRYKAIDDLKAAGKIDLYQELEMLKTIQRAHAVTEEEKLEAADRIRQLRLEMRRQEFDEELKLLGRRRDEDAITTKQLIANLERLREKYADNLELRQQLDEEIYNAQRQYLQERYDLVENVGEAIVDALKNQYQQQRDAEKAALKDAQTAWKDWEKTSKDATKSAFDAKMKAIEDEVNAQLKALDDVQQAQDRSAQDEADRKKIAELQLQLDHERDPENRYQLEQQLAAAIKARDDRLAKQARDDQKEALKEQLATQKEALQTERDQQLNDIERAAAAAQADLDGKLDQLDAYWDDRLSTQKLRAEAERLLIADDQKQIISLLKEFNPEYDAIGKSWGQKLVEGFGDSLAQLAEQTQRRLEKVQSVMETALRSAQAVASPTSAVALAGSAAASPGTVINLSVTSPTLTESELEYLVQRVNRQLGAGV